MKKYCRLIDYIEDLRKSGKYLFLKKDACQVLGIREVTFANSVMRLAKKGKVAHLKKGFYQITTEEYANDGSLPPEWFIDDLMRYLGVSYYVGLLTAATIHGSSHHAPQIFQVICNKVIPPLKIGKLKIAFYYSKNMTNTAIQKVKVPSGYINVSPPENTAFDLIRYLHQSGHLNHVATVLSELAETMNSEEVAKVSDYVSIRYSQRLGYILDALDFTSLTKLLHKKVLDKSPPYISLRSDADYKSTDKNEKWRIYVNEKLEIDV
jgi:predicted transcriptional regulator of viral defense system